MSPKPPTKLVNQPEGAKKQQTNEIFHDKPPKYQKCELLNPTKEKGSDGNEETIEEEAEIEEKTSVIAHGITFIRAYEERKIDRQDNKTADTVTH